MSAPRACGRLLSALFASTLIALALWIPAAAQAAGPNAVQALAGCTTNTLPANDDGSTGAVPIGFPIDLYGDEFTELFVNNNGNVTFFDPLSTYTPFDFTTSGDPMIAPFLADVDTRGFASNDVTYGQTTYDGQPAFCVNWVDVGYYSSHDDKLNSFQLILVDRGGSDFDIVMNYDRILWETGDASDGENGFGGTSATMGFSGTDGDPAHFHVQPGAFEHGGFLDSNSSTGLIHNSHGTSQLGRYIFQVRNVPVPGPKLTGTVTENAGGDEVPNAFVEICREGGSCVSRQTNSQGVYRAQGLTPGNYDVTAHPSADVFATPGHGEIVLPASDDTQTLDIELGPAPQGPPEGTDVPSAFDTSEDGLPVVLWTDPVELTTAGCEGGTATYTVTLDGEVVRTGSMAEGPPGQYSATMDPLAPATGFALITIDVDCADDTQDEEIEFGIYIDPSGWVRNSQGAGLEGATVTLYRSHSPSGPFTIVPDGSAIMSPSNRVNPDSTDQTGHFGWDVVAGYYKVRAEMEGCVSNADRSQPYTESRIMEIPPPVFDLDLRLYCGEGGGNPPGGGGQTSNPVVGGTAITTQQGGSQQSKSAGPCAKLKGKRRATCQRLQNRLKACRKLSKKAKRTACAKRARALAKCEAKKSKKKKASCVRAANRIGAAKKAKKG